MSRRVLQLPRLKGADKPYEEAGPVSTPTGPGPRIQTLAEFFAEQTNAERPADLVQGLIPGQGVAMFNGQPRDGKTFAALECLLACATGTPAFDILPTVGPLACWYITDEDPAIEIRGR